MQTLAYVLTLAGMAGVFLVPRRLCVIVHDFMRDRRRISVFGAWLLALATVAPALVATKLGVDAVPCALRSLAGEHCTASRAGGLIGLATFGLAVVVMESAGCAAWLIHRHCRHWPKP